MTLVPRAWCRLHAEAPPDARDAVMHVAQPMAVARCLA